MLYRYGVLTQAEVARTLEAATADERFGEAAVRLGLLPRETLFQMMAKQIPEIVYAGIVGDGCSTSSRPTARTGSRRASRCR